MATTAENQRAVGALGSCVCEACGKVKDLKRSFCKTCYYELPVGMRNALYRRLFEGYGEAYAAALVWLKGDAGTRGHGDAAKGAGA